MSRRKQHRGGQGASGGSNPIPQSLTRQPPFREGAEAAQDLRAVREAGPYNEQGAGSVSSRACRGISQVGCLSGGDPSTPLRSAQDDKQGRLSGGDPSTPLRSAQDAGSVSSRACRGISQVGCLSGGDPSTPLRCAQDDKGQNLPVTAATLCSFTEELQRYRAGKRSVERRAIQAENWWKLRSQGEAAGELGLKDLKARSGWLHNVIVSKHADLMEAYPEPNILPRESGDVSEARVLSKIVPVILEQNRFEEVYSDCAWQKLKTGTGIYKVTWDADKLGGLGDVSVTRVDILNLFWEPGVDDIQDSRYVFHTSLRHNEELEEEYPELRGKLKGQSFTPSRFMADDSVGSRDRSLVVDCYYKRRVGGATVLHYCKYVGDTVLYSTENLGERGLYDHSLYPFVFDRLYPVEGSPAGYGYIDLCANAQEQIDLMQTALLKNTLAGAVPRYFQRSDGAVNEEEFLDLDRPIVHVTGTLGEEALRPVQYSPLSGNYIAMRQATVDELRQVSGNTDSATGNTPSGVTAAAAIAALQEAAGKGSRDATRTSYRAFSRIVELCIELIRQFYTLPRQFRITGDMGSETFISYSNAALGCQSLGGELLRLPVFDVRVEPAKRSAYSRVTQNELALQFYKLGFFAPQQSEQALLALEMMDFDDRDRMSQLVAGGSELYRKLSLFQQYALAMTAKYEPERAEALAALITGRAGAGVPDGARVGAGVPDGPSDRTAMTAPEDAHMTRARARSRQASEVGA